MGEVWCGIISVEIVRSAQLGRLEFDGKDAVEKKTLGYRFLESILSLRLMRTCKNIQSSAWDDCKTLTTSLLLDFKERKCGGLALSGSRPKRTKLLLC